MVDIRVDPTIPRRPGVPLPSVLTNHAVPLGALAPAGAAPVGALSAASALRGALPDETRALAFSMETQLQTNWCWAAVSVSVSRFYNSASTWIQCGVVNAELGETDCCLNGSDPRCDQPWYLDRALTRTGNLQDVRSGAARFAQVRNAIRAGDPICARIGWTSGGGHFVAITGFVIESGDEFVDVEDPISGHSNLEYTDFESNYQSAGRWTHSYWTQA